MKHSIYIARHERYEAAEVYKDRMSKEQIEYLKEHDKDFQLVTDEQDRTYLLEILDEG